VSRMFRHGVKTGHALTERNVSALPQDGTSAR
jgi:hypothetical protein